MNRLIRSAAAVAVLAAAGGPLFAPPGIAEAHERRDVGKYQFLVGWSGEPAFEGQRNALFLRITVRESNEAVAGAEQTLKAEVTFGGQRKEVALRGVFNAPGSYTADLLPTREGDYRFRFFGAIDGQEVNETFDSADKKFNGVESIRGIQFPAPAASPAPAQVAPGPPAAAAGAAAAPSPATQAALDNAQTLGMAGVAAGILALVISLSALARSRPRPS